MALGREAEPEGWLAFQPASIPGRAVISWRSEQVERKDRACDRVADTIIGGGYSGALVPLVDRAPEFVLLQRVCRRTADSADAAMPDLLLPFIALVQTVTAGNGREFADHARVAAALRAASFFGTPYHSRERGLNEHRKVLVQECVTKVTEPRRITDAQLRTDGISRAASGLAVALSGEHGYDPS